MQLKSYPLFIPIPYFLVGVGTAIYMTSESVNASFTLSVKNKFLFLVY